MVTSGHRPCLCSSVKTERNSERLSSTSSCKQHPQLVEMAALYCVLYVIRQPKEEEEEEEMEQGEREASSSPSEQEKDVLVWKNTYMHL